MDEKTSMCNMKSLLRLLQDFYERTIALHLYSF